jgi:aryl-alcohol dehydrogenase-like predicted oxidoreductase/histidinol phosphatase-like enzyme/predicted kinase
MTLPPPAVLSRPGLGCMRLSTARDRDESSALAVLHKAFAAGITFLDTADAYGWDDSERNHNERLIARAIATWDGDRSLIRVATKGGLIRRDVRWEPDGRATHLIDACHRSLKALDVARIHLYQLHAPDPRTPLATSVRAFAKLKADGLIERIGLCNVTVDQIEEARRIAEIDTIQVELSFWRSDHLLSGVAEYCVTHGLRLLAYRPLAGGTARRRKPAHDAALEAVAARHQATPSEIALAWLMDLSTAVVPIPGATRIETVRSVARSAAIALTDEDRRVLDREVPAGRTLRNPAVRVMRPEHRPDGEIVLVMGLPAAGKSTLARSLVAQGYHRLNRDEAGGTLAQLLPALDATLESGATRIVLDNTYVSRKSRAEVIRAALARGFAVRCLWLATDVEDAQTNAVGRIISRYGRLPDESELKQLRKKDVSALPPGIHFRYRRELEPPHESEGFSRIDVVNFERRYDDALVNRAVIVWCDGVLMRSRSGARVPLTPDDVEVIPGRTATLRRYRAEGVSVLGLSWQPEIADGRQSSEGAKAVVTRMCELLDFEIEVEYCPHAAGPPTCWCRKPLPGLGVVLVHRHRLNPAACIYVGAGPQDPGFARRLGFEYREADDFFSEARRGRP